MAIAKSGTRKARTNPTRAALPPNAPAIPPITPASAPSRRDASGHARAAQCPGDDSSRKANWRRTRWSCGQLIDDKLDRSQNGKDGDCPRRSHKSQRGAVKVDPTQMRGPSHNGGRCERPQTRYNPDAKSQQQGRESGIHDLFPHAANRFSRRFPPRATRPENLYLPASTRPEYCHGASSRCAARYRGPARFPPRRPSS